MNLTESSIVVRGFRGIGRSLRAVDEGLVRTAADKNAKDQAEVARVQAIAADSRLVQWIERLITAPEVAWRHSRARTVLMRARETVDALEPWQRVRLVGWMVVVAVTTRVALYALAGNALTTPSLVFWGLVFAVGAFMMAAARSVAVAWVEWRRRRS